MRSVVLAIAVLGCTGGSTSSSEPPPARGKLELNLAPRDGDLAAFVAGEVAHARQTGKHVLVYVGADWCEPCRKFHEAAQAGQLDAELGDLRLVELDLDRDQSRLEAAGYHSEFVPLFAVPRDDGRASGAQTDGVRKAAGGALEQLVPRIRALVP
jgi:thiol-disulfide isomerase/thioredoxin